MEFTVAKNHIRLFPGANEMKHFTTKERVHCSKKYIFVSFESFFFGSHFLNDSTFLLNNTVCFWCPFKFLGRWCTVCRTILPMVVERQRRSLK